MKIGDIVKKRREELGISQVELAKRVGYTSRSAINKIEKNVNDIPRNKIQQFADTLQISPSYLMGWDNSDSAEAYSPVETFPVIGDIAAGFDRIAIEDWCGETVDIPTSLLKGHSRDEFVVLSVKGDSMYPLYQENDKVLILKQSSLNYSGQIGAVIYDDCATLKKVEYKDGENWLKLIAVNPAHPPRKIENEALENCRILGVPRLLIRDIDE